MSRGEERQASPRRRSGRGGASRSGRLADGRAVTVAWRVATAFAAVLLLAFLILPIVALIATTSISDFIRGLMSPAVGAALKISLATTGLSLGIIVLFGTPLAWMLAGGGGAGASPRGRGVSANWVETLVQLPIVTPPAVAGVALLLAFGREGLVGGWLAERGWAPVFTGAAVVMAQLFVAAPFFLRSAITAFRSVDETLLRVGRSLGASPLRLFFRLAVPLAAPGLVNGAAMSWARALGEFGATLMFAGNLPGRTQTLPLAIYTALESDVGVAQSISLLLVAVAFLLLLVLQRRTTPALKPASGEGGPTRA